MPAAMPFILLGLPALVLATIATAAPAPAQDNSGATTTTSGPKLSNNQPIQIESDKLEVHQNQNEAIFTGNVNVVQGDTLLKAGKMYVYYIKSKPGDDKNAKGGDAKTADNDTSDTAAKSSSSKGAAAAPNIGLGGTSQIDHVEVEGKVYVKSQDQVATGDRGTFDMKTQIMTLSGKNVVLTQGQNVVVGCRLVANMKTGQSKLDGCGGNGSAASPGRVKMLLTPTKKNGAEQ